MAQIIEEILKKYGLEKIQEGGLDKFFDAETAEKAQEILDDLPGVVLSQILRELEAEELTAEKLPEILHKNLKVSQKIARDIAEDLLKEEVSLTEEEPLKPPPKKEKPDVYREPTE